MYKDLDGHKTISKKYRESSITHLLNVYKYYQGFCEDFNVPV